MKQRAAKTRGFRPWPSNLKRVEYAEQVGINISDLVNEMLEKHLKEVLEQKVSKLRKTLNAEVP